MKEEETGSIQIQKKAPIENKVNQNNQTTQEKVEETSNDSVKEEGITTNARVNLRKYSNDPDNDVAKLDLSEGKDDSKEEDTPEEKEVEAKETKEEETNDSILEIIEEDSSEGESTIEAETEQVVTDGTVEKSAEEVEEPQPQIDLPENVQKVVEFMNETGGTLEDYVALNRDFSKMNHDQLIREYIKETKKHFDKEDIDLYMEDKFSYDEDIDDEKDIRKKKLAKKEFVSDAIQHFDKLKEKYHDEVKLKSKLTPEAKEAVEFYENYKQMQGKEAQEMSRQQKHFKSETDKLFGEDFKGFEFNADGKKFRYNVKDVESVKQSQSDLGKFLSQFLDEESGVLAKPKEYHRAVFAAQNVDKIAEHFYQQGKAEAVKSLEAKSKNIQMDGRKGSEDYAKSGGLKVRQVTSQQEPDFKFKTVKRK